MLKFILFDELGPYHIRVSLQDDIFNIIFLVIFNVVILIFSRNLLFLKF